MSLVDPLALHITIAMFCYSKDSNVKQLKRAYEVSKHLRLLFLKTCDMLAH
jgi:hypothetical protein